jgi:hypothetical protein
MKRRPIFKTAQIILLVIAVLSAAGGYADKAIDWFGMGRVATVNQSYLDNSMNKAVNGFLILSGIKTGLAVVEGSEVGIGFNFEIGDIVQSVYDYVDIAWKTALAGGTVILITRLLLQTVNLIDHWFLALAFIGVLSVSLINWVFPHANRIIRFTKDAAFFLAVCTVVLYLIFPLSIAGAAFISERITGPLIDESQKSFESIKEEFAIENINRRLFPDEANGKDSRIAGLILKGKVSEIKDYFKIQAEFFKDKSRNVAIWTLQLIAGYLFDSIVFPIVFFFLLFVVTKGALLYVFEDRKILISKNVFRSALDKSDTPETISEGALKNRRKAPRAFRPHKRLLRRYRNRIR